ncbi:MAG TPA: hypothetical protein VF598_03740 [Hymenobacter sp.]
MAHNTPKLPQPANTVAFDLRQGFDNGLLTEQGELVLNGFRRPLHIQLGEDLLQVTAPGVHPEAQDIPETPLALHFRNLTMRDRGALAVGLPRQNKLGRAIIGRATAPDLLLGTAVNDEHLLVEYTAKTVAFSAVGAGGQAQAYVHKDDIPQIPVPGRRYHDPRQWHGALPQPEYTAKKHGWAPRKTM